MPRLLWADLETTGLQPLCGEILEVAVWEADLYDPFMASHVVNGPVYFSPDKWSTLDPYVLDMHTKNGLLEECSRSVAPISRYEEILLRRFPEPADKDERTILAGSSVHFDYGWLNVHMPTFAKTLSYRLYDVSALKLECQSQGMPMILKKEAHRAMDDIKESISHAKACREWQRTFFSSQRSEQ